MIRAEDILKCIKDNTVLISVMAVNNETGADNRKELIKVRQGLLNRV